MSTSPHASAKAAHVPEILGDLLHSLCQPLTTLRCSLELSLNQDAFPPERITSASERQQEGISIALQQTDEVIRLVQLMRDYLDTAQHVPQTRSSESSPCKTA